VLDKLFTLLNSNFEHFNIKSFVLFLIIIWDWNVLHEIIILSMLFKFRVSWLSAETIINVSLIDKKFLIFLKHGFRWWLFLLFNTKLCLYIFWNRLNVQIHSRHIKIRLSNNPWLASSIDCSRPIALLHLWTWLNSLTTKFILYLVFLL